MSRKVMKLPKLNCLKPNEQTNFKKLVEEIAECNTAVEELIQYEDTNNINKLLLSEYELFTIRYQYKKKQNDVMGEIMDIAQVCCSQLFMFEDNGINVQTLFDDYMDAYDRDYRKSSIFKIIDNCRYIYFSFNKENATLHFLMSEIISSMGNIAQLGKFTGENGEVPTITKDVSTKKHCFESFKIIQNCFNLLYRMEEMYHIDMESLFEEHVEKLIRKGYCIIEKDA